MISNFQATTAKALVIDGRGMTRDEVRAKAQKLFSIETLVEDSGPNHGDHGFFFVGDPLHYYHVQSVMPGLYVVARHEMRSTQTKAMVTKYLKQTEFVSGAK